MARDDLLIIAAVAIPVVAYAGNIGGFRTWADSAMRGGQIETPNQFQQPVKIPGGTTITPQKAESDILGLLGGSSYKTPLGQIYDAVSSGGIPTKCWRNYPCGSRTTVAICKRTAAEAYNTWKNLYACKGAKQAYAYEGFDNVTMG